MPKFTRIHTTIRTEFHPNGALASLERILHIYVGDDGVIADLTDVAFEQEMDRKAKKEQRGA